MKPDGKRNWIVSDSNGVSHSITSKSITFILGMFESSSPDLIVLDAECHERAEESCDLLQIVWEAVSADDWEDGNRMADVEAISDIIFSDATPINLYSTHLLLSQDKVFFKERNMRGRTLYEARSQVQVAEARMMQEANLKKAQRQEMQREAFKDAHDERSLNPLAKAFSASELERLLEALKFIASEVEGGTRAETRYKQNASNALQSFDAQTKELVKDALSSVGKKVLPSTAMETLVSWGVFNRHENLALLNSAIPHMRPFSTSVMSHAEGLLSAIPTDLDCNTRRDYSHLPAFAIDSVDTTEVDDALSWDPDTNRILVHIADPTRYFPDGPSNPIIQEALRRSSTMYLPSEKFTMFPESLAESLFSLDGIDSEGCALTFAFSIDDNGSIVEDSVSVEPSSVSAPIRFTYEDAEELLSQAPQGKQREVLHILHAKAIKRRTWRKVEGGAIIVDSSFSDIKVTNPEEDNPDIEMQAVRTDTKSWTLVSELMVAACTVAADITARFKIPVPFRGQEPFDYPDDDVLGAIPNRAVRGAVAFRNASPSMVGIQPTEHAALGLDAYLQVTSPIRRTLDLLSHFQIKAFLRGDDLPFSAEEMLQEIGRSNELSRTLKQVENRTKRYWQLEFLRRLGPEAEHEGVYLRPLKEGDHKLGLVHLEDFAFPLVAAVPPSSRSGNLLRLRVVEADPRMGMSQAEAFFASPEVDKGEFLEVLNDALSETPESSESTWGE